jgi:hypothetical protein
MERFEVHVKPDFRVHLGHFGETRLVGGGLLLPALGDQFLCAGHDRVRPL